MPGRRSADRGTFETSRNRPRLSVVAQSICPFSLATQANLLAPRYQCGVTITERDDQYRFMTVLGQTPARLTAEQVAWMLNRQPSDMRILVGVKLLKPLGNPPANNVKFFATLELLELVKDRTWLAKFTNALDLHWQKKNAAKRKVALNGYGSPVFWLACAPKWCHKDRKLTRQEYGSKNERCANKYL